MTSLPAGGPAPHGAGPRPPLFIVDEVTLTEGQWTQVMNRYAATVARQPARIWPPLPRRTRLRLAVHRQLTRLGEWLGNHVRWTATERLWRVTGLLGKRRG